MKYVSVGAYSTNNKDRNGQKLNSKSFKPNKQVIRRLDGSYCRTGLDLLPLCVVSTCNANTANVSDVGLVVWLM